MTPGAPGNETYPSCRPLQISIEDLRCSSLSVVKRELSYEAERLEQCEQNVKDWTFALTDPALDEDEWEQRKYTKELKKRLRRRKQAYETILEEVKLDYEETQERYLAIKEVVERKTLWKNKFSRIHSELATTDVDGNSKSKRKRCDEPSNERGRGSGRLFV